MCLWDLDRSRLFCIPHAPDRSVVGEDPGKEDRVVNEEDKMGANGVEQLPSSCMSIPNELKCSA